MPDGAPRDVREGELPDPKADTKFAYLWNCRAVLDQARRIVLATDNDGPGQALAEELARRLGKERCFRVRWGLWTLRSLPPSHLLDWCVVAKGLGSPASQVFRRMRST